MTHADQTEQTPWKAVIFGAGASIILFMFAFTFLAPGNLEYFTSTIPEKAAQFKELHIIGKEKGKPSYKLYAKEGWATPNNTITTLKDVGPGSLYQEGSPVAKNLRARYVKVYRYSKEVEAFSKDPDRPNEKPLLSVYIDLGKFVEDSGTNPKTKKQKFTLIFADYLKYFEHQKRSILRDNIKVKDGNTTVLTTYAEVDHHEKSALFSQGLTLYRKNLSLEGAQSSFSSKKEEMDVSGNVIIKIKNKKSQTQLECQELSLYSDPKKDFIGKGAVRVVQPKKVAFAQECSYNQDKKTIRLKNQVKTILEKLADILKEDTIKNLDDPDEKEAIKEKTVLTCDEITIFTDTEDALAKGNVTVTQKEKEARADQANYQDKNDRIILSGNVYMKKGKEWVAAREVTVSIRDETFEAMGEVKSEFKIKK